MPGLALSLRKPFVADPHHRSRRASPAPSTALEFFNTHTPGGSWGRASGLFNPSLPSCPNG
jgi:hypothetical protein